MLKPELTPSYDISLRNVFAVGGASFLRLMGIPKGKRLDTDVSKIAKRNVDYLVDSTRRKLVVHLEFQRSHDRFMPYRMLDYSGAILATLTLQDAKFEDYQIKQFLLHVGRTRLGQQVRYDWGGVQVTYDAVGSLSVELDGCPEWDVGDAALSIICRNGTMDRNVDRALDLIWRHERAPELLGIYLALAVALPGAYEKILFRSSQLGFDIDLSLIPQVLDRVERAREEGRREDALQTFWEFADLYFPGEVIEDDLQAKISEMSSTVLHSVRRDFEKHISLRQAVMGTRPSHEFGIG